jgi:ribonucleoside-diphosphate reductase subunit M1
MQMAADRGVFIDQSQSLNIHMENNPKPVAGQPPPKPLRTRLNSAHFTAWKLGLKTGMYYLRTKPAVDAVKVTLKPEYQTRQAAERAIMLSMRPMIRSLSSDAVNTPTAERSSSSIAASPYSERGESDASSGAPSPLQAGMHRLTKSDMAIAHSPPPLSAAPPTAAPMSAASSTSSAPSSSSRDFVLTPEEAAFAEETRRRVQAQREWIQRAKEEAEQGSCKGGVCGS